MRQPVLAIWLRLGPPFALIISLLVRLAAVQSLSAGHSAPQQGPAPHFLTVSWKLRRLKNPGIERGKTVGVIITWKTTEDDKNNLGMCSRRLNRDRARKREADSSHWCQPPSRRSYGGLPESIDLLWTQGPRPTGEALRNQHCAVPTVFTEPYRDHLHSLEPLDCVKDPVPIMNP